MLELDRIKNNRDNVIEGLKNRGFLDCEKYVDEVIKINEKRKDLKKKFDNLSTELNNLTEEIHKLIIKHEDTTEIKEKVKSKKEILKKLQEDITKIEYDLVEKLADIPNVPSKKAPIGKNSKDNVVVFQTPIVNHEHKVPHYELIEKFDIIDFELGNKLSGAGFPVYKGIGAKLQRALINFFLDEATAAGFKEHEVPIVLNKDSFFATGQLPDKEKQMYKTGDSYLIPTAEVPLTNIYRNVIVNEEDLPIKLTGYTPCFRREAGSWGKDVRGLNRLHQFDKIEIVEISKQEDSYLILEKMRIYVEGLVKKLELPYRVLALCTGDLGYNSAFTYDIEVYSVGQDLWLEASSISNFETYQANRLNLKYKDKNGKKILAHTLNGSALALPRIVASLLEWYYDGEKIVIPTVLQKYMNMTYIK